MKQFAGTAWVTIALMTAPAFLCAQSAPGNSAIDSIQEPLTATPGDAARGRAIVTNRQVGLCLLCHSGPFPEERFQGNLAPGLAGAGARRSEAQLRLRVADARRLNPQSIMPTYLQTGGGERVAPALQGKPILTPQQIEDVVAFLATLEN
jgi:L-cysteine S-thiosulfotransferase